MIQAEKITIGYNPSQPLLEESSFATGRGELVALIGRNGAGKSTLLRAIAALSPLHAGSISLGGVSTSQMTAQQMALLVSLVTTERIRIPNLTCQNLVALGRSPHTNWMGRLSAEDRHIVATSLAQVGMSDYAKIPCDQLSDGELQRVMIARALAQQTPIILLDEPTAFLDMPSRYSLMELLGELAHTHGKCIIFSTHELDLAIGNCDTIALLSPPELHLYSPEELADGAVIKQFFGLSVAK